MNNNSYYPCVGCGIDDGRKHYWHLSGYHGFNGRFCRECYNKVAHDAYGKPKDPEALLFMSLKLGVKVT